MSNAFAQRGFVKPIDDPAFANDQIIDPSEVTPTYFTTLWKKNAKGQMQRMQFPKNPNTAFPKCMYGIDVPDITVRDPDEEKQAIEAGYVDHPDKAKAKASMKRTEGQFEVSAIHGTLDHKGNERPKRGRPRRQPAVVTVQAKAIHPSRLAEYTNLGNSSYPDLPKADPRKSSAELPGTSRETKSTNFTEYSDPDDQ